MLQSLPRILLVATLLLGQWLALTHDYQHPLKGDESCQICLHAPNFHGTTGTGAVTAAGMAATVAPVSTRAAVSPRRLHSPANSRAPPTIPV